MKGEIRGLSLTRPWPFAFHHGKRIENRSWRPSGRLIDCYIALHAAKSWSEDDREFIQEALRLPVPDRKASPDSQIFAVARWRGGIVLSTPLTNESGLRPTGSILPPEQDKWFFGPYGWLFEDYVELPEPVQCIGARGLWILPEDVKALVREKYQKARTA
jgi:hypothetical protein